MEDSLLETDCPWPQIRSQKPSAGIQAKLSYGIGFLCNFRIGPRHDKAKVLKPRIVSIAGLLGAGEHPSWHIMGTNETAPEATSPGFLAVDSVDTWRDL